MQGPSVCLAVVVERKVLVFAGVWAKIIQILSCHFTELCHIIKIGSVREKYFSGGNGNRIWNKGEHCDKFIRINLCSSNILFVISCSWFQPPSPIFGRWLVFFGVWGVILLKSTSRRRLQFLPENLDISKILPCWCVLICAFNCSNHFLTKEWIGVSVNTLAASVKTKNAIEYHYAWHMAHEFTCFNIHCLTSTSPVILKIILLT